VYEQIEYIELKWFEINGIITKPTAAIYYKMFVTCGSCFVDASKGC
jgi:hypothetical protein